jgi:hypothetical protein
MLNGAVRTIITLLTLGSCAPAQTPLVKILSDELDRNLKVLK